MKLRKPCNCQALIKAIDAYIQKADDDIEKNLRQAGFVSPKKTVQRMQEIEEELTELLEADTTFIITTIQDYDGVEEFIRERWPELQNDQDLVAKLTKTFEKQFSEAIPEYMEGYAKRIESDIELESIVLTHATTDWISDWSGELSHMMKLNDNNVIEKILNEALKNGDSVQTTAQKIADSGIRDPGYRSRRVATTEMLRAHSVAQHESIMESPAVEMHMWRHSGWRQYARANHMAIDGQIVDKNEPFTLFGADGGLYHPMYPRDGSLPAGESINCGCLEEPIVSEDVLGLSLEERNKLRDEAIAEMNEEYDNSTSEKRPEALAGKYVNKSEQLYKNLQKVKPIEGYEDVAIHGEPGESMVVYDTTSGITTKYTAGEFAEIIKVDPEYHGGNIRLLSCGAGSEESQFAKGLATAMNKEILAPTETLWVSDNGELFITDSDKLAEMWYNDGDIDNSFHSTGYWKTFKPGE